MKNARLYRPIFQGSAGSSQAGVAELVQRFASHGFVMCANGQFWRSFSLRPVKRSEKDTDSLVKITVKTALDGASDSSLREFGELVLIGLLELVLS
jgi:hypothetical protein